MKYDIHGLQYYLKAHKLARRAVKIKSILFYLAVGWILGRTVFTHQDYILVVPIIVLASMYLLVQRDTERAAGFSNLKQFERLGQPPNLSLNNEGFHFEENEVYKATLLQEVPNEKNYNEYWYLIKKVSTSEHYVAKSPIKLPYQTFTFSYKDTTYTFYGQETIIS